MNPELRSKANFQNLSLMDYILKRIKTIENTTGLKRTIFAVCPNSLSVLRCALNAAKRNNAPVKFAATLNQVDTDGGYTGLTQKEFVDTIRIEARKINLQSPVIVAVDHGGPWLKDKQKTENWNLGQCMDWIKKSFEASISAGYDLIHVDPTVDISISKGDTIKIETVVERTVELISHCEEFRKKGNFPKIAYEVGTEEVHGGLADMQVFTRFLDLLKSGLQKEGLTDVWPCFVVGKVGTDLHTNTFDPEMAKLLTKTVESYGSVIKGHYSDNVSNPQEYPLSGMGAANIGPEFTEKEYEALCELELIEQNLFIENKIARKSEIKKKLWNGVINSGRWKKWLFKDENSDNFFSLTTDRQEWLIKTGCRYIWENPEILASRSKLFYNLGNCGINAQKILEITIEKNMDKYFNQFNLVNLNDFL
ncbi:MAG: class II D-tagatose-bisphosphate aldolase, non-catalytic subunit [Bacteroidales bacterium]